jgi:hypothetical protein
VGLLIVEILKSQSDALHSVGFLWTNDRPEAEISDITRHSEEADIHDSGEIRICNSSKGAVADRCLRPRGVQDRQKKKLCALIISLNVLQSLSSNALRHYSDAFVFLV